MKTPPTTTTASRTPQTINVEDVFYPCYTNLESIRSTVAFGWTGLYDSASKLLGARDLHQFLLTVPELTDVFDSDKLKDLATDYIQRAQSIRTLHRNLDKYLRGEAIEVDTMVARQSEGFDPTITGGWAAFWQQTVFKFYEEYRVERALYGKILLEQLLHDFLWNPAFDPHNPQVVDINKTALAKAKVSIASQPSVQESVNDIINGIKAKFDPRKYKFEVDADGSFLIKKKYDADLPRMFKNTIRLLKAYKDANRFEEMKPELAKLYFINDLIEMKYTYNRNMTTKEKSEYKTYTDLRSNVLSAFKLYLSCVLETDTGFDFSQYYEASPYSKVLHINREQIKGIRNVIGLLIGGH